MTIATRRRGPLHLGRARWAGHLGLLLLFLPRPGAAQCRPTPMNSRAIATNVADPRLTLGSSSLFVSYASPSGARPPSSARRVVRLVPPDDPTSRGSVVHGEGRTEAPTNPGVRVLRVRGEPALVRWSTTRRGDRTFLEVELHAPSTPGLAARFRRRSEGWATVRASAFGESVFVTVSEGAAALYVLRGGETRRLLLSTAAQDYDAQELIAVSETEVLLALGRPDEPSRYLRVDTSARTLVARAATGAPPPPPRRVTTRRASPSRSPWIAVAQPDGRATAVLGFDDEPRFSASSFVMGGRRWLAFSEGLRAATRVFLRPFQERYLRVEGPSSQLALSDPSVEAGRVSTDAHDGRVFASWVEGTGAASRLMLAELVCRQVPTAASAGASTRSRSTQDRLRPPPFAR